jgi:hypothetical protein
MFWVHCHLVYLRHKTVKAHTCCHHHPSAYQLRPQLPESTLKLTRDIYLSVTDAPYSGLVALLISRAAQHVRVETE